MAYNTDIERLNYYEGEFLGALDFQAEQEYHRDMRRRHNIGQHTWGIVTGLDLAQVPNGRTAPDGTPAVDIYVQPGTAIDAYGREIIVLNKTQITQDLFAAYTTVNKPGTGGSPPPSQLMDVWISYAQVMLEPPSDPCTAANQHDAFGRVQEAFALTVTKDSDAGPTNGLIVVDGTALPVPLPTPSQPGDITFPPDASIPYQEFSSDDSTVIWFILLGKVSWFPSAGAFAKLSDSDASKAAAARVYVGSVASTIYAPGAVLLIKDRFSPSSLPAGSPGVATTIEGSLDVVNEALIGSYPGSSDPGALSPLTVAASSATDADVIQLRDSTGSEKWLVCENPGGKNPGLHFGEVNMAAPSYGVTRLFVQSTLPTPLPPLPPLHSNVNVGIGTVSPRNPLAIRSQGAWEELLSFEDAKGNTKWHLNQKPQNPPGMAPGLNFSETGVSDFRLFLQTGGNVGIGTGTPVAILDVRGQAIFQGALSINNAAAAATGVGSSNDPRAAITFGATDTPSAFYFGTYDGTTGIAKTILGLWSYQFNNWIQFWTPDGNAGIGTASPNGRLEVQQSGTADGIRVSGGTNPLMAATDGTIRAKLQVLTGSAGLVGTETNHEFGIYTNNQQRVTITNGGDVGIGTASPATTLDVQGTFHAEASVAGGETATGWVLGKGALGPDNWLRLTTTEGGSTYHDFAVNSFWAAGVQQFDLAEVTPVSTEDVLEQGDVVVIDREFGMQVTRSTRAFDTSVYGVVSSYEQASMVIGGFGGPEAVKGDKGKLPIALVGRAKAKVTTENGAIEVGDLLTTSSTPGHLMRCGSSRCTGSIVGKALEAVTEEFGLITIRVCLG